ncbi:type ISP restriction/modification enzyme [Methylosinus sporium]|uniref:type ISP restriction/modification enzyme n=1 Tax=Methylosinus sporium TaxID=428 RepID=UPI00383B36E4
MSDQLLDIVENYFAAMRDVHRIGAGTKERSYYPAVAELLNAIGQELKPKVICLSDLGDAGAGHPDFGLFAANQVQKGEPRKGQMPERGVIEMKGVADETWLTAKTGQVSKYFGAYRLVIVTNIRDFLIIGEGPNGQPVKLEGFRLAPDAKAFWELVATPKKSAEQIGRAFGEYLKRALTQSVALREPKDVAWFLASYARDALQRVDEAGGLPALANVRASLEEALGVRFTSEKGEHFFRSTLVQTLFYGVFSAWVLWARETPRSSPKFEWRAAVWHLTVPFIRTLFQQIASPQHLQPLHLVEVLDWTAATLNRVDATEFFRRFNDADAVQFFYEPFLEAFDPELRKELGVWYTPNEVVSYMVARVDKALRDDLGVEDGLASEQVYILDPCCGTGAFLAAVLKRVDASLEAKGLGALKGQMVKKAALSRVFGFEIMPAPFVVAHLQVGLALQTMGAALDSNSERPGVYLTNALTGWEPHTTKPLPFPELEQERDAADTVKQKAPILVILGNPPYNGHPGVAIEEERELSVAYRTTKRVRKPEGRGLNDLYVRFYRMAERRIAEKTGRGVVCFISNYSWLDGLSFTGMRERYMEAFDAIRIDCLNGDKYKTGKTTPEGKPDPSIFSTEHNREGIQVGTAIVTLIRKAKHTPSKQVAFRHLWGVAKRQELQAGEEAEPKKIYAPVTPPLELGLPFVGTVVSAGYFAWPKLPELLPSCFPGIQTSRDEFLVDVDRERLLQRVEVYFDPTVGNEELRARYPVAMTPASRFDPVATRSELIIRGQISENIVRYAYRPFDVRWIYWEPQTKLLNEKRSDYWPHVAASKLTLATQQKARAEWECAQVFQPIACLDLIDRGSSNFPLSLSDGSLGSTRPNLSKSMETFLLAKGLSSSAIFLHIVAVFHAPTYRVENAGGLRMDWPRVPVPSEATALEVSAQLGDTLSKLLDSEAPALGVSSGKLRAGLATLALPTKRDGNNLRKADLALSAGWGYLQIDKKTGTRSTMPGQGTMSLRDYTDAERKALAKEGAALGLSEADVFALLGQKTLDVHLNADAYWSNVPENVWSYTLGGYQVVKKWLSYREQTVLGRALKPEETAYVSEMVRRIAAILLMGPSLDKNYEAAKANAVEWKDGRPVT